MQGALIRLHVCNIMQLISSLINIKMRHQTTQNDLPNVLEAFVQALPTEKGRVLPVESSYVVGGALSWRVKKQKFVFLRTGATKACEIRAVAS